MRLKFEPFPKQFIAWELLHDSITTELGYGGSAFSGKSWLLINWIIFDCLAYPGIAFGLGRKELINLKKTTLMTFFKACRHYDLEVDKHYKYDQQKNIITFKNDSEIFLLDMAYRPSDPLYTRFGGLELTYLAIDESNENDIKAIRTAKTRTGRRENDKYGLIPKSLETFNPDKAHVYERYYKPFKDTSLPEYRKFIPALPTDNPYTTPEYIEELKKQDEITVQRLLYGNFEYDDNLNKLFNYDRILEIFTNDFVASGDKFITADVAEYGADNIVMMVWQGFRVIKIIVKNKQSVAQTAADIKELSRVYEVPRSHIVIDDDGIGKGVSTHLPGIVSFRNGSKPLNDENYENLQAQCLYKLAGLVNDNKLYIETEAVKSEKHRELIIQDLDVNERKDADKDGKLKIKSKDDIKRITGRSPDFRDALLMRMIFELKKPVSFDSVKLPVGDTKIQSIKKQLV